LSCLKEKKFGKSFLKMKIRENSEINVQLSTICRQLKLETPDGKLEKTKNDLTLPEIEK